MWPVYHHVFLHYITKFTVLWGNTLWCHGFLTTNNGVHMLDSLCLRWQLFLLLSVHLYLLTCVVCFFLCSEPSWCTESTCQTWASVKQCSYYWCEASGSMAAAIPEWEHQRELSGQCYSHIYVATCSTKWICNQECTSTFT